MTIAQCIDEVKKTSARAVVQAALERAKNDPHHALLAIIEERALMRADQIDAQLKAGKEAGILAGVPFIAKDNMLTFDSTTTAAAELLANFRAPFQAECIERLEAAGAICIGKSNLDAFAHGASTENSAFGPTTNPHDPSRVAGGSSGGSAAAVALDIVPFALGSDTGGSIRQPASYCGVVGLKPTYGSVSRYGVVAMASSTDVIGPLTHTVEDAELVMSVIAGKDDKDSTTIESPYQKKNTAGKKIGVVKEWLDEGVDIAVKEAVRAQVTRLKEAGYTVEEVSMPHATYALAVYYIIVPAEVTSNLARYDGVRYGVRPPQVTNLSDVYEKTRSKGFMPENMRRIMLGNFVLSSGYYDAYFQKAAKVRTLIVEDFKEAFARCDFLIGPTAPTPAFALGQNTHDPLSMYLADIMTVPASLAGVPSINLPLNVEGLPIGLQVIGPQGADTAVLDMARHIQEQNR